MKAYLRTETTDLSDALSCLEHLVFREDFKTAGIRKVRDAYQVFTSIETEEENEDD